MQNEFENKKIEIETTPEKIQKPESEKQEDKKLELTARERIEKIESNIERISETEVALNEIREKLSLPTQSSEKSQAEKEDLEKQLEEYKLIEVLRKECISPIENIGHMPVMQFAELIKKFKTTDLKLIVESEEYKKMISDGFILGSGEQRVYYDEKPGRISKEKPTNVHLGLDFMVKEGMNIKSIADGEIVDIKNMQELNIPNSENISIYKGEGGYGNMILVKHKLETGQEVYSLYGHLANFEKPPKKGDIIHKGDIIGKVGKSFAVENGGWPSHLHFSILKSKEAINGYGSAEDTEKIIDPLKVFQEMN